MRRAFSIGGVLISVLCLAACGAPKTPPPESPPDPRFDETESRDFAPAPGSEATEPSAEQESKHAEEDEPASAPEPMGESGAGDESGSFDEGYADDSDAVEGSLDDGELLLRYEAEFASALAASDCVEAERFRALVCELADRICVLASELPRSSSAHSACTDGRSRCKAATRSYRERCD